MPRPSKALGQNTIVVIRAPLVLDTRDNSYYRDWINATKVTVHKCMVEPMKLAEKIHKEDNRGREFVNTPSRVYCPAGTDILYTDRVEFLEEIYSVFGHPGKWFGFDGAETYTSFVIVYKEG